MREIVLFCLWFFAIYFSTQLLIGIIVVLICEKKCSLVLSMRYICRRIITWFALLGVALGVMVLIVVLSVMDGFRQEVVSRLQGIFSHIIINVRDNKKDFAKLEQEIRKVPHVIGCAPHLRGIILIATKQYDTIGYVGGVVIGIDYQKEYEVGKLQSSLVTAYQETRLQAEQILEDNIRRDVENIFSWEVLGIKSGEGQRAWNNQNRIVCKRISTLRPKANAFNQSEQTTYEIVGYVLDDQKKIAYIELLSKQDILGLPALDTAEKMKWQTHFDQMAAMFNSRQLPKYMDFFNEKLQLGYGNLDPTNPFIYIPADEDENVRGVRPILVGYELMRQLNVKYGDEITLMTGRRNAQDGKMSAFSRKFTVVGAFKSGWQEIDAHFLYSQRQDLLDFLDITTDVNEIAVELDNYDHADQVLKLLDTKLNPGQLNYYYKSYQIQKWEEMRKSLLSAIRLERMVMVIIISLIVGLAIVSIMIMLILLVAEKTKDIGILKAMGATDHNIMSIFIFNGLFISFFGSLLGCVGGAIFSIHINSIANFCFEKTGLRLFPRDVYSLDQIPISVDYSTMAIIVFFTLVLTILFCTIPALKAARLDAVEALNSESPSLRIWSRRRKTSGDTIAQKVPNGFFGVTHLAKEYIMGGQTLRILDKLNFEIKQGEIMVILGSSGAGKSTLLHMMGLLDTPTEGIVYYQGKNLNSYSEYQQASLRNKTIGFIFQFYHLLPELTALENVMLGNMISYNLWQWTAHRQEIQKRAIELLQKVGLSERLHHRPVELSGGERQRVAIARALMMNPKIVLCDEPTGNLDETTSLTIQNLLWQLNAQMGQTFIIVTHEEHIAKKGNRVFRLEHGRLCPIELAKV